MSKVQRVSSSSKDSLPSDTLIDQRYLVQSMLGRGGMGYVYRVFDTARERVVALKQLSLNFGSSSEAGRALRASPQSQRDPRRLGQRTALDARKHGQRMALFRREFHTLAELAHPHIISVYDYGFHEAQPYYTMELLTGSDIGRQVPLRWPKACAALRDVASALTLLHSRRLLHRDVSPSNVHLQLDGSIKLIDFGAMGPLDSASGIVGTPPFMAPEVLRQERLDVRTDLYSLGALGFYLLTGRTVYPARSVAELCDFVGVRPSPPSQHAQLPAALDELILQLLSPERSARPSTTVEVIERLSALAGQEHGETTGATRVWAPAPSLVARREELATVRRSAVRARHGKGASIVLSGAQGSGRSRLLEACALEGKLSRALVLRADPQPPEAGPLATWRVLLEQLHASLGARERRELALPKLLAEGLLAGCDWTSEDAHAAHKPQNDNQNTFDNARLIDSPFAGAAARFDIASTSRELRAFVTAASERRTLLLAIDDVQRLDHASLQLLGTLASRAHANKLLLLATLDRAALADPSEGLETLLLHSQKLGLAALDQSETQALLASLFGDVPNLAGVAHRVHALSAGNPRMTVELAEHLIERAVIRYEGSAFVLPDALSPSDLPESMGDVLRARVSGLSPAARELCSILALAGAMPLSAEECVALSELSAEHAEAALSELGSNLIIERQGVRVVLRQTAMAEAVAAGMPALKKRVLHARIARLANADPARRIEAAEQYFGANLPLQAVDALLAAAGAEGSGRSWHANYRQLVERGVEMCEIYDRPAQDAFLLRRSLAQQILSYHEPCERAQLLTILQQLCRMSGLTDWHELSALKDPGQRLSGALARAQARYDAANEHERVLPPGAAIRQLVAYSLGLAGYASSALDLKLLEEMPSLAPLAPLSATIGILEQLIQSLRHLRAGRTELYLEFNYQILQRLGQPDAGGFPENEARSLRVGVLYGLALTEAVLGRPSAFQHADELEGHSQHVLNAWRARQTAHMFRCNPKAADAARQQVELLQLQQRARQFHQGGTLEGEFLAYLYAEDLLGLRRVLPAMEQQAARHPCWGVAVKLVRATLQRVRGRPDAALTLYEELTADMRAGRHTLWGAAAAGHVSALNDAGRFEEARAHGAGYVEACREHELRISRHRLELALAIAESALGQHGQAIARVENVEAEIEQAGFRGLHRGAAFEAHARIALALRDAASYREYFAKCSEELGAASYPGIAARLARLEDRAAQLGLGGLQDADAERQVSEATVAHELERCPHAQRPARALSLVLRATGAESGYLYLIRAGELTLAASASEAPPPAQLAGMLQHYAASAEALADQTVDVTCHTSFGEADAALEPLLLRSRTKADRTPVAVLALHFPTARRWPSPQLMDGIGDALRRSDSAAPAAHEG